MNVEQLQMILDSAAQAGEGAFWIALIWLGKGYLAPLLWFFGFATFLVTARRIAQNIATSMTHQAEIARHERQFLDCLADTVRRHSLGQSHAPRRFDPFHDTGHIISLLIQSERDEDTTRGV